MQKRRAACNKMTVATPGGGLTAPGLLQVGAWTRCFDRRMTLSFLCRVFSFFSLLSHLSSDYLSCPVLERTGDLLASLLVTGTG